MSVYWHLKRIAPELDAILLRFSIIYFTGFYPFSTPAKRELLIPGKHSLQFPQSMGVVYYFAWESA